MIIINKGDSSVHDHHLMVIMIVNMIIFGSGQTDSVKVYYLDVSFCVVDSFFFERSAQYATISSLQNEARKNICFV